MDWNIRHTVDSPLNENSSVNVGQTLANRLLIFHYFSAIHTQFNSSDGRVVRSVCLLSCRIGFDSESGQTNDFKNWYSQLPCLTLSIEGTVWRTSRQVYLLCRWERHLAGFPHLGVVDRWPATPKRARIAH